ncbi:hypothetical protein HGB25_02925 [Candidatus Saccharibacteria bacterium]|nr:hypothetical protein [Candidatus Saccharibacteria bacterium]
MSDHGANINHLEYVTSPSAKASEDVAVAVQALDMLGLVDDPDQLTESYLYQYDVLLKQQTRPGEFFIQVPISSPDFCLRSMISVIDGDNYGGGRQYPPTEVWETLWGVNNYKLGYTYGEASQIGFGRNIMASDFAMHPRLAVNDGPDDREPLLHFIDRPMFEQCDKDDKTQMQLLAETKGDFEVEFPEFYMAPLNVASVAMIALQRRIKGEPMPIEWGLMRIPYMGQKPVRHAGMTVAGVKSRNSQLIIDGAKNPRVISDGIGLSVGINEMRNIVNKE